MNDLVSILVLHLLESTEWVILFLLFTWLFRIRDSRIRCWVYRASLLKFLIPTTVFSSWLSLKESHEFLTSFVVSAEPVKSVVHSAAKQPEIVWPVYIWLTGILIFAFLAAWTGTRIHKRIHTGTTPFSGRYLRLLRQSLMDTNRPGKELPGTLIEQGPSIALYGIFRPRIIAKPAFLETLDDNELASALQHEAAHWIRRDNVWRLLTDAITAILWFHPLIWFIRHRLILETEKACDETVLSFGKPRTSYANCLLKAAEFSQEKNHFGAIALSETSLKQRISHVIHYKKEKLSIMKKSAVILTCLSLFGWSLVAFANETKEIPSHISNHIFEFWQLDTAPKSTHKVAPVYPPELKKERIMGTVNLEFIIDEKGDVIEPAIERSTNSDFNEPTLKALKEWKFTPGIYQNTPVKTRARIPFSFALREPKKEKE